MKMRKRILLCAYCIDAIRSRGESVYQGELDMDAGAAEETGTTCEWCDEIDDLYECLF